MKLLNLTNRYYIVIALFLLLISVSFLTYRVIYLMDKEISDHMRYEKMQIEKQIALQPGIQDIPFVLGDRIQIDPIPKFTTFKVILRDTTVLLSEGGKILKVPYRVLSYEQLISNKSYRITLWRRLTENRDLGRGLVTTIILVALDIIACFYFLNRWFSSKIWRPFYRAINVLKKFDLQKGGRVLFQRSNVEEFNTLNAELTKLTDKVTRDYRNLREFTENMSHETQTPLAIIRSKLELLLQSENLKEDQVGHIRSTLDSVNRLSKMNKSLILLTRIENEQYATEDLVSLGNLLRKQLESLDVFIENKEIKVQTHIDDDMSVRMNQHLADILLTNLLSNAIKYCTRGGELSIMLTTQRLMVSNTGPPLTIPGDQIFERFKKGDSPDSVGLGLAIVKKIGGHCNLQLHYEYINGMHCFYVEFRPDRVVVRTV
ncbi:MAG: HAMP domain-containing histidine kinase [Bacteroidetes bacterium]|nr:HAMP domain-containing histidine kinase [Bacteroidota bacterium]MBP6403329.1 HAMP domain-containing histidine kinase [Bacteroidia bacterium]